MVGHLHPGRRCGRYRRQRRRGAGDGLVHDAHRHSQRHGFGQPAALDRRNHRKYARNLADITVRQNIQLHWLTIESLPEIVDALNAIGLSPKGACGDVVRNVTGCPLASVAADELIDASPVAREIAHHLTANSEFYNLPRKFKISATGCPAWCTYPEINDIGLTPVRRGGRDEEVGYSLRVGGGLSNEPHLAVRLDAFVRPDQAVRVVRGVAEIFRDQQALRESRERARLKYLFMREGWTAERSIGFITYFSVHIIYTFLQTAK